MKYYILKEVVCYLNKNATHIKHIKRIENNTIAIEFDERNIVYFDLSKGNSLIYKRNETAFATRDFLAPFDLVLQKRFNNSKIEKVSLYNDDKIILFEVLSPSSYKQLRTKLYLEFTGKYTNIVIADENDIVLEALRHIDEQSSSRIVKVGQKLQEIPKADFVPKIEEIEDIEILLHEIYKKKELGEIENTRKKKDLLVQKQILKYQKLLNALESEEFLENESGKYYEKANLILANIHKIKAYEKFVILEDYKGNNQKIELDLNYPTPSSFANSLFAKAKKAKQKAKFNYIERQNLEEKIVFYSRLRDQIKGAKSIEDLEFLLAKKEKNQTKTKKQNPYESYFFKSYKILLGRNERENIYLLKNSKASDFWFHLKDRNSCHVIVQSTKKTLPVEVVEKAAFLCASFSVDFSGAYLVDWTQRRNVKIQSGANVLYNPYDTVSVKI